MRFQNDDHDDVGDDDDDDDNDDENDDSDGLEAVYVSQVCDTHAFSKRC